MDIDAVRKEAGDWKDKYEQPEREHAAALADMEFDRLLSGAISAAKGRSVKAVLGELGAERVAELKSSKNQESDIKAALEALKGESGYLFQPAETPPPYASGTGTHKVLGEITKEKFAGMGYRERLELKQNSPEIYKQMKE